ncbi:hypothetical protein BRDID11002_01250 [Bradyrhizobium diazoefficiens]
MISATLSTRWRSGNSGRAIMITGRPSVRAASILARAPSPAGIAGDDPYDAARTQHLQLAIKRERSARHDHVSREGQRRFGRIDEAQCVGVLRFIPERRDVLAADGEEHVCRRLGQSGDRCIDVADLDPVVTGCFSPGGAFERDQRRAGFRACRDGVAAHLGSERMRRVDHMRDAFTANVIGEPAHAAEAADAGRQRLVGRRTGAAAIGIDGIHAGVRDLRGKLTRIARSAQNEGACHG